jgi:serine/threonine protein kinase
MHAAFSVGARFGRYTLLKPLAVGGMAEIYLARAEGIGQFQKQVVLKRILPQFAQHDEFVEMFLHEARLAAGLQHPNIVHVFDIGQVDGDYFFTMEYVHGHDLRSVLKTARQRNERIPIQHVLAFISEAAAGLHNAHEQNDEDGQPLAIVHRDVSPSNIMVSFDGAVKVADFGIAKARSQTIETRAGTLKGKISYMSPEQCRGDRLDRRSDVFALGIVLHELATGQKLFSAESEAAVIRRIIDEDAPRLPDDLAPGLADIAARALARDRDVRYATAQDLQLALEGLAREHRLDGSSVGRAQYLRSLFGTPPAGVAVPAPTPAGQAGQTDGSSETPTVARAEATKSTSIEAPSTPKRRARWPIAVAVVAVLGGGAAATWALRGDDRPPETPAPAPVPAAATPSPAPAPAPAPEPAPTAVPAPSPAPAPAPPPPPPPSPATATVKPKAKPRTPPPAPPAAVDRCHGWTPSSFDPPPEGCDRTHVP